MAKVPLRARFKNKRRRQHPTGDINYSWDCMSCTASGKDLTIGKMHYGKFADKQFPHDVIVRHRTEGDMGPIYCF